MIHKDIRRKFEAHGRNGEVRRYVAVGFLNDRESRISGDEVLRRVPDAIGEEDWAFLWECVDELVHARALLTNRRPPNDPRHVSYFGWNGGSHYDGERWLSADCDAKDLVLCRLP